MSYYLYLLECQNNAYYTGYTSNIERRYQEHVAGSLKCKYTRSFPPKRLAVCWKMELPLSEILKIECKIKRLSKQKKIELINHPHRLAYFFPLIIKNVEIIQGMRITDSHQKDA
ncbi:MAG: hypothetical protein A3F41_04880 [Coxiella sp. RIFCSPHIGHO2_12_FULL_44_14]|nr:MAG: hypothetical protein A3F41_04880 [Coxiella sp. RIFCSPHIGHO2_12_FULL_44_14]